MRKFTRTSLCVALAAATALAASMMTACGENVEYFDEYELSAYTGGDKDTAGKIIYNTSLFYNNNLDQGYPDPQVLDDTARSGYYYLYGTSNFQTMRSRDLAVWETVKVVLDFSDKEIQDTISFNRWAPEVIYDGDTELYYLFFSASPNTDKQYDKITASGGDVDASLTNYCMYVATSASPEGPFRMINFWDAQSCGAANVHDTNQNNKHELTQEQAESGEYAFIEREGKYYEAAFRNYWAKYCLFEPAELSKLLYKNMVGTGGAKNEKPEARYFQTIDPHPYVDPVADAEGKHKKYLYFKLENNARWNINIGVEMENWLKPKWETAKYIIADRYYTIADWAAGNNAGVSYEFGAICNEGAHMLYHEDENGNGLYYFAFSVNDYSSTDYQVALAVADSPLGDFRKLREKEGGLLLSSYNTDSDTISGAGHHSYVTVGDQLFIVYHRHRNADEGGGDRYTAIDEIKWITVEDKDGNDLTVPYVNGPTDSIQPLPEKISGYKNVAPQATVTCSDGGAKTEYLTDGLLSVHKSADETFMSYIGETKITSTATIDFAFNEATSVRAIMVYNSASKTEIFRKIPKIEFTLADGTVRVIRDVKFDTDAYCKGIKNEGDKATYVLSGAAAFAEFYDIDVTNIKITVEVPSGQARVGLSEIKILGKA